MKRKSIRKIKAERIKEKRTETRIAKQIAWGSVFMWMLAGAHWILGTPKNWIVLVAAGMLCYSIYLLRRDRLLFKRPRKGPSLKLQYLTTAAVCWQSWSRIVSPFP